MHSRNRFLSVLIVASAFGLGCNELAKVDDPNLVADGSPKGMCSGVPTACEARLSGCGFGCDSYSFDTCYGTAVPCESFTTDATCSAADGCHWWSYAGECSGSDLCFGSDATSCTARQGCLWGRECFGTAEPCEGLAKTPCQTNLGCTWLEVDAGM